MSDEAYAAKQELLLYREAKRNIQDLQNKIEVKEAQVNAVCKPLQEKEVQYSRLGNSAEKLIDALIELKEEYMKQIIDAERLCYYIELKISCIKADIRRRILSNHYLYNQSFEEIAFKESFSYRDILRKHFLALEDYSNVTDKNLSHNVTL